jgi:hypothetical protein
MAIIYFLGLTPTAFAATMDQPSFPDIPFQLFSTFVENNFSQKVTLAMVLTVLFTLTSNPDLLNLPACQQKQVYKEETSQQISGWIKALSLSLEEKLGKSANTLFSKHSSQASTNQTTSVIGDKLDNLSKLLKLHPYDSKGNF